MTTTIKNIKITQTVNWTCRRWGGVFLGLRIHFPVTLTDYDGKNNNSVWSHIFIGILILIIISGMSRFKNKDLTFYKLRGSI